MKIMSPKESRLPEILERTLDKGVVVDTRVRVNLASVDLLGLKAAVQLSSFKTAEKTGLSFPYGTRTDTRAWQALKTKLSCPICGMESSSAVLDQEGCPWCGWNCRLGEG